MNISLPRVFILLVLISGTFFLLQNVSGVHRTPIKQPLALFPAKLDDWQVVSTNKSSNSVVEMLGVDDYLDYNYTSPNRLGVNLYVAFYESVGVGGGYHSPRNCIPGGGWGIDSVREVQVVPHGRQAPVNVMTMIIRNRNEYQLVMYWYQNRGRVIHSEYWEKIYQVLDAILLKRRDGTFVRLIAPAPGGNIPQAEETLKQFAALTVTELDNFLPGR